MSSPTLEYHFNSRKFGHTFYCKLPFFGFPHNNCLYNNWSLIMHIFAHGLKRKSPIYGTSFSYKYLAENSIYDQKNCLYIFPVPLTLLYWGSKFISLVDQVVPWWLFWYIVRSFTKGGRQIYPICVVFVMLKLFFSNLIKSRHNPMRLAIAPSCAASSYGLAVGLLFPLYISFYTTSRVYWKCILEQHKTKFSDLHSKNSHNFFSL